MQPVIVMPMHDPQGAMFPHLEAITPELKTIFAQAFVSITHITRERQAEYINRLEAYTFFDVLHHPTDVSVGEDFLALYTHAASSCRPDAILHLCFIDRVAFALQSQYQAQFRADIRSVTAALTPLIFLRSAAAWQTHPRNYRQLEQVVTQVGELLLNRTLDFAWCHLVVQAQHLQAVLPRIRRRDLSMVAELVLHFKDPIQTREVDWLAWEDPFIYNRDPRQLKQEREESEAETRKRLAYVLRMLQLLAGEGEL
jgi:hypothetical protein